jgi:hypothetical protein
MAYVSGNNHNLTTKKIEIHFSRMSNALFLILYRNKFINSSVYELGNKD